MYVFFVLRIISGPRVKLYSERPLNPPVVYTTDHSKAVGHHGVLILCSSVVYTMRRFMFGLSLPFVYVFLLSF